MPLTSDLLNRKANAFVLWHPKAASAPPALVIGTFQAGNPPTLAGERHIALAPVAGLNDLFAVPASDCGLQDGQVYHYWFEVDDTDPNRPPGNRIRCTDPAALTVDWRLRAPALPAPYTADDRQPAAVMQFQGNRLVACDPGGESPTSPAILRRTACRSTASLSSMKCRQAGRVFPSRTISISVWGRFKMCSPLSIRMREGRISTILR